MGMVVVVELVLVRVVLLCGRVRMRDACSSSSSNSRARARASACARRLGQLLSHIACGGGGVVGGRHSCPSCPGTVPNELDLHWPSASATWSHGRAGGGSKRLKRLNCRASALA
ncbi:hypothetical protein F4802DRAFT_32043 [Xylaria palmicola]|nr:hypothetical protein F4802DRAFT_32043 [Xylaria palmicola]